LPHPLAFSDVIIGPIKVRLKLPSTDGVHEKKIAVNLEKRIKGIINRRTGKPWNHTAEEIRRFLDQTLQQIDQDNGGILSIYIRLQGTAGPGGNTIGLDILVPN
jgi:hypothetical protein